MVKRKPFSPVDANRAQKSRQRRACASRGSNRSINSNSTLESLADDSEFDFLSNPTKKAAAVVNNSTKDDVWNSSTKTPKISNCTVGLKNKKHGGAATPAAAAAAAAPRATAACDTRANATANMDAKALSTTVSNKEKRTRNLPPTGPDERKSRSEGSRRRRRSKKDKKRRSKEDAASLASNASSLETIFEGDEDSGDASPLPPTSSDRSAGDSAVRTESKTTEPSAVTKSNPVAATQTPTETKPPEISKAAAPNAAASKLPRPEQQERELRVKKEGVCGDHSHSNPSAHQKEDVQQQHSPDEDGEDMDETEIEDFLDLTLSPPTEEQRNSSKESKNLPTAHSFKSPMPPCGSDAQGNCTSSLQTGGSPKPGTASNAQLQSSQKFVDSPQIAPLASKNSNRKAAFIKTNQRNPPLSRHLVVSANATLPITESSDNTNNEKKKGNPTRLHSQLPPPESHPSLLPQQPQSKAGQAPYERRELSPESSVVDGTNKMTTSSAESLKSEANCRVPEHNTKESNVSYQPEDPVVWAAMTSKPPESAESSSEDEEEEEDTRSNGSSPIGLLVETPASDPDGDQNSIDGSVLTQEEIFLVDVKQSHRKSKSSKRSVEKLPPQLFQENLFKEIGRKSSEDDVFETPRYEAAENRTTSPKSSSTTASHASSNIAFKATADANDDALETQSRESSAVKESGKSSCIPSTEPCRDEYISVLQHSTSRVIRTDPPSSARLGESDQQGATTYASGSSNNSQQITTFGAETPSLSQSIGAGDNSSNTTSSNASRVPEETEVSPPDVITLTMEKPATMDAIETVDPCNFSTASNAPKTAGLEKAVGKGANRTKRAWHPSTKNSLGKTNSARPRQIPWTAELAGRTYRALGVNIVPVFKLNDGRSYRHPPLPPGWNIGVSRSRNIPFYTHPDFGSTFFCPVPLPSGDGRIVGTTLHFETDTPMMGSVQSFGSISPPSETRVTPAVFGSYSPEQMSQGNNESNFAVRPVTVNTKAKTPAGAFAVATDAMYSELIDSVKAQETENLDRLEESAQTQTCSSQGDKASEASWKVGVQGSTPIGAFAVAANAMYSSLENIRHKNTDMPTTHSTHEDEVEQSTGGSERPDDSDIPLVVEIVTKSGSRQAPSGPRDEAQSPTDYQEVFQDHRARCSRQDGESDPGLICKTADKTAVDDDQTAATSLNLSDDSGDSPCSSPPDFVWFGSENGGLLDDSEDRAVVRKQRSRNTPSFKLASAYRTDDQTSFQKANPRNSGSSTWSEHGSEQGKKGFDIATYASSCNDSPSRLSTDPSSATKKSNLETDFPAGNVTTDKCSPEGDTAAASAAASDGDFPEGGNDGDFPEGGNETASVASDGDFPEGGDETASVASDGDFPEADAILPAKDESDEEEGGDADNLSASTSSLPVKVIFGSETSDDDVSRLESTPMQKQKRRTKISTRFDPTAIPWTDPHRGHFPTVLEGGSYHSIPCGDEYSHDSSMTSHSYMSSVSTLSRVSHHVLHPPMPLCCLQNLDALPVCKKKRKKTTKNKKSKKRAKPSVPVSA